MNDISRIGILDKLDELKKSTKLIYKNLNLIKDELEQGNFDFETLLYRFTSLKNTYISKSSVIENELASIYKKAVIDYQKEQEIIQEQVKEQEPVNEQTETEPVQEDNPVEETETKPQESINKETVEIREPDNKEHNSNPESVNKNVVEKKSSPNDDLDDDIFDGLD